ncbi:MAG: hypothetical protein JNK14_10230 [Chitinophagaceae bacterium]|nr:hypothetical protein [Chitinophagaceae bacterium]
MPQRYKAGDRVRLKVAKTFTNPPNLPVGSPGTVRQRLSDGNNYRIEFDARGQQWVLIRDRDLQP